MKLILTFATLLFVLSCKKERSDLDQVADVRGGRCLLSKASTPFLCLNFNTDYDANTASETCKTEFSRYKTSSDINGISSLSGNSNTCANASSATSIGNCARADGVIFYYDNYWTITASQNDCTSIHGGKWSP